MEDQPKKETTGNIIIELSLKVAVLSEDVSQRLHVKLQDVMTDKSPVEISEKALEAYPPFFHSLRVNLLEIESNLRNIVNAIDRTEL